MRALFALLICLALAACTDEDGAREALENEGFTDISFTGYAPLACGKNDFYSTEFIATNVRGKRVRGVVCSGGMFKNSTVRW